MSFFGFDPKGHNQAAPGFSQAHDPFAGLSGHHEGAGDAVDFEDTYDGLGDQLDETGDDFNDDTFGGDAGAGGGPVGKDFDFFGRTAQVANAIEEEHMLFTRNNATAAAAPPAPTNNQYASSYNYAQPSYRPARTGYEKYDAPDSSMDLQVDPTLWGVAPAEQPAPAAPTQPSPAPAPASGRKVMSLEEVEAAMKVEAQARKQAQVDAAAAAQANFQQAASQPQQHVPQVHGGPDQADFYGASNRAAQPHISDEAQNPNETAQFHSHGQPVQILQRPRSKPQQPQPTAPPSSSPMVQQRQQVPQPTQILQNPNRLSGDAARVGAPAYPSHPTHQSQGSIGRQPPIITHPSQLAQLSEDEKAAYLEQEARRAKRNHKIYLLSRDNGIMTPHDKNFITRIQLQQLVAATGNPSDNGTDEALAEDFYYQVHNQIRGGQRQNPSQPLSNFAQTYLYQTGNRQGGHRRHRGGPENHMQRMEQQVQRAVEAAKNKPKNSQLVIEGSLGKISFSNAKTPKPLLNIKRTESGGDVHRQGTPHKTHPGSILNRKNLLADIEKVYNTLMKLEDHGRKMPPPATSENDSELVQQFAEWEQTTQQLNQQLWRELKIHEPVPAGAFVHPFIAMLETAKGKKAIPRVFRHVNFEQRTTILTLIVVNLDKLDVVRRGSVTDGHINLDAKLREDIELFSMAVHNTLFMFMGELELNIITGILGLLCSEANVDLVARTRVGAGFLTMILSRAEIMIQQQGGKDAIRAQDGGAWERNYANLFNILEPTLPYMFPGTPVSGEDAYVWQLLAALGIGANADQQQRLVVGVKDRVLGTVEVAKTLPQDLAVQRLNNVNLFMQAIGLDVSLLG
ncbi:topoisomerase II-associated protein PAT1 [Diaporthe sp. PMI_573]|nr:topoisomerase II-associated protein PAT1 [Diaporthaceae sp. PMI_573]